MPGNPRGEPCRKGKDQSRGLQHDISQRPSREASTRAFLHKRAGHCDLRSHWICGHRRVSSRRVFSGCPAQSPVPYTYDRRCVGSSDKAAIYPRSPLKIATSILGP
jgi:hypothetical protein